MKNNILFVTYQVSVVLLLLTLSSCNDKSQRGPIPRYTEHPSPAKVTVKFPKDSKLPELDFHIDNNHMRIFNKEYLPYQSKVDSAYLRMVVSTLATTKIYNETTQQTFFLPTDTSKVDLTGGRLKITIEVKDEPTLVYDMRILSYGYDPNQFTWERESTLLPESAIESKVVEHSDNRFWIARGVEDKISLYRIGVKPLSFEKVLDTNIPMTLKPSSIITDKQGTIWALGIDSSLYYSDDIKQWNEVALDNVSLTMLLTDAYKSTIDGLITAVGYEGGNDKDLYTYIINKNGRLTRSESALNDFFPVSDAYVYSYDIGGIQHSYILGGLLSTGKRAPYSFFTSDGISWGMTPYMSDKQDVPSKGGLYLRANDNKTLYVIGGEYNSTPSNEMKISTDRGVSWNKVSKKYAPGINFTRRTNASGFIIDTNEVEFYIFGGIVGKTPIQEVWHGWLDKSGGIVNDFK